MLFCQKAEISEHEWTSSGKSWPKETNKDEPGLASTRRVLSSLVSDTRALPGEQEGPPPCRLFGTNSRRRWPENRKSISEMIIF